ncbi:hypothetical protein CERSUDRAFT_83378 [Gelatoporia subvermispora B]|uniref:Uncharacterized protein n=1 Tax=Ceriporiopsis subvermispora (strain B) TaxID=914234 RepID=M2QKS2_CERS8|nr:hypothetical protein CERSUDRAFT_83378 [Gelatoporia subvermispora B]
MQAIVSAFMIIRIYALYGRSRRILAATMGVVAVSAVIAIWSLIPSRSVQPISLSDDFGCDTVISDLQAKHLAGAWACMLLIDTFIFVLTITKVIQIVAVYRSKSGLIGIILRDGVVYYLVMLLVNLANFVSFLVSNPRERGLFTTAVNVTSSLLVSRLAFNVHAQAQDRSSPSCVTHPGGANTGIESCPTVYSLTVQVDLSPQYDMEDTLPCAGVYVQS